MLHDPPAAAPPADEPQADQPAPPPPENVPSTPCAVWVLGWKCTARVLGIDASRVCSSCRVKLPAPPYGDLGQFTRWADLVWDAKRRAREARIAPPSKGWDVGPPPGGLPATPPQPLLVPPGGDPKADVGDFSRPATRRRKGR